jgi:hypothetical protein
MAALLAACSTIYMPGGPFTQAQLISGLEAHGYRDVALGDSVASSVSPGGDVLWPVRSADDPEAQKTSVHLGSNGTAVKDGQLVYIYLRPEAPATLPPATATAREGQRLTIYLDRVAQLTVEERTAGAYFEPRRAASPPPAAAAAGETRSTPPRSAPGAETISSDIALRLAEMVFVHNYGREVTDAQLPLSISDGGDRWEIHGRKSVSASDAKAASGGRLGITIMKADARIVDLER